MANPHNEEGSRKFNSMEILLPKTGEMKHLCKLPQSVYMPGELKIDTKQGCGKGVFDSNSRLRAGFI